MFFVVSESRFPFFGCLSKVIWEFKIKTELQSLCVEKLLTFPFPNSTVRYWQHSSYQRFSFWYKTTWSLTVCPVMRGFCLLWDSGWNVPSSPSSLCYLSLCPEPIYRSKQVYYVSSLQLRHYLSAPKFICWIINSAVILPSLASDTVTNGLSISCVGPEMWLNTRWVLEKGRWTGLELLFPY